MEVSVLTSSGVPADALLSIRAGAVRRQAPLTSGRPFQFPKAPPQESPLKIDLFKQIGSAFLVLKPGEDQYKVWFSNIDCDVNVELGVKQTGAEAKSALAGEEEEERPKDTSNAKAAKDYLEGHQVIQFVQAVLQTVIKEKPKDPFDYMARHFTSGYRPTDVRTPKPAAPTAEEKPAEEADPVTPATAEDAAPTQEPKVEEAPEEEAAPPPAEPREAVPAEEAPREDEAKAAAPADAAPPATEEKPTEEANPVTPATAEDAALTQEPKVEEAPPPPAEAREAAPAEEAPREDEAKAAVPPETAPPAGEEKPAEEANPVTPATAEYPAPTQEAAPPPPAAAARAGGAAAPPAPRHSGCREKLHDTGRNVSSPAFLLLQQQAPSGLPMPMLFI